MVDGGCPGGPLCILVVRIVKNGAYKQVTGSNTVTEHQPTAGTTLSTQGALTGIHNT